jgi:ubiquinone/menaquinone biosynthesis C-methylase UbiE
MAWKGLLIEVLGDRELRVLDVGTGTGFIALLLAELGHEVIGVDISEEMLRIAREKARKLNIENVEFHLADAEEPPFPDNTFDAVVADMLFGLCPIQRRLILNGREF